MRPRFESDLGRYSELAKSERQEKQEKDEADAGAQLEPVIEWHLQRAARRQGTDVGTQREIYDIQKAKQEAMDRLRARLRCLDNPECEPESPPGSRDAEYREADGGFRYLDDKGVERTATFGDVVTDLEWGVRYHLSKGNAPRPLMKRYYIEQAKQEIGELLDAQIIKSEVAGRDAHEWRKDAYRAIAEERESGVEARRTGFIAERMVKNMLRKAAYDADAPFEVREADVFQDVQEKIDFIVHRTDHDRGVGVDAGELPSDVGVQFSINTEAREKKRRQLEQAKRKLDERSAVDDIVLVVMSLPMVREVHAEWERQGKPAGGPDRLLGQDVAGNVFRELLKGMLGPEEIKDVWKRVRDRYAAERRP